MVDLCTHKVHGYRECAYLLCATPCTPPGSFLPSTGRPNSAFWPLKPDTFDRLLPFTVKPSVYGSDSSIPSSIKSEMETSPETHYVITTGGSPPNGTSEEPPAASPPRDISLEEDPYSDPIDALATFNPDYLLYRRTPDAYPILVPTGVSPQQLGSLRKVRRHSSADNIFTAVEAEGPSEGVYSVPFDALLSYHGLECPPAGDRRVRVVVQKERPNRAMTDRGLGQLQRESLDQMRSALLSRSQSWKGGSKYRPRSQPVRVLGEEALRSAAEKTKHCNLKQFHQHSPDVTHPHTSALDARPDCGPVPAPVVQHDYCEIDLLPEKGAGTPDCTHALPSPPLTPVTSACIVTFCSTLHIFPLLTTPSLNTHSSPCPHLINTPYSTLT